MVKAILGIIVVRVVKILSLIRGSSKEIEVVFVLLKTKVHVCNIWGKGIYVARTRAINVIKKLLSF